MLTVRGRPRPASPDTKQSSGTAPRFQLEINIGPPGCRCRLTFLLPHLFGPIAKPCRGSSLFLTCTIESALRRAAMATKNAAWTHLLLVTKPVLLLAPASFLDDLRA